MKIMCKVFGCSWRYNFPSLPNRAICKRCFTKAKLNLHTLDWETVLSFGKDEMSNEEMIKKWFK